jgi:plasmid stabilization system protein ParE
VKRKRVILMDKAHQDLIDNCTWWAEHRSEEQAERWYDGFSNAIKSLATEAERHAIASESANFPFELRQLNYGLGARPTHRAVYTIRPDMILVLRITHLAQHDLTLDDI